MLRSLLRARHAARIRPIGSRGFCLPLLVALTPLGVPAAGAQTLDSLSWGRSQPAPTVDPWTGIHLLVTPAQAGEVESADLPPPQAQGPEPAPATTTPGYAGAHPAEPQIADTPLDQWHAPSLYTALDLGLGGAPVLPEETPAPNTLLPERASVAKPRRAALPTSVDVMKLGPASASVSADMSANAPVSSALNRQPGGGNGEVKAHVGYSMDNLSVYGTGKVGASASTGAPAVHDGYTVGSSYQVPLPTSGGEKLGARVEVDKSSTVKTGVELRAPMGSYERFISVDRSSPIDASGSEVVKAGVLGKF